MIATDKPDINGIVSGDKFKIDHDNHESQRNFYYSPAMNNLTSSKWHLDLFNIQKKYLKKPEKREIRNWWTCL